MPKFTLIIFILIIHFFLFTHCYALHSSCPPQTHLSGLILKSSPADNSACQVEQVIPLSRAWNAGLRAEDWIDAINGVPLKQSSSPCKQLKKILKQALANNTPMVLQVRNKTGLLTIPNDTFVVRPLLNPQQDKHKLTTRPTDRLTANLATQDTMASLLKLQNDLASQFLQPEKLNTLYSQLACVSETTAQSVLPLVKQIQSQPMLLANTVKQIQQQFSLTGSEASLALIVDQLQAFTVPSAEQYKPSPNLLLNSNTLVKTLQKFIELSQQYSQAAFAGISHQERRFFLQHYAQLSRSIEQSGSLLNESNQENLEIIVQLFKIAAKVNDKKLSAAAQHWLLLSDQKWLRQTIKIFPSTPLTHNTAYGKIILGSYGDDIYQLDQNHDPVAIIIDPGGNDRYLVKSLDSTFKQLPFNTAIIDLSGNDHYQSSSERGFATATLNIALLVDLQGDDWYQGYGWSQASAFAGIAALVDFSGNDRYDASHFSQATALFGSAVLLDKQGNDRYQIKHHGQGLGLPYGAGLLLDQKGNDQYRSNNGLTSTYPNTSTTESWAQGYGKGFRPILPGGIGILLDGQGDDTLAAQEFAQGSAYYFGLGLLYNLDQEQGNDNYTGSRYNLGSASHQAVAGFMDTAGDDRYTSTGPAFCGTAWDQSISLFYDKTGNDHYMSQEFSLAAAAHNSIASFWDISGQDSFAKNISPACISSNQYHGGHSLSYFFSGKAQIKDVINPQKQEFVLTSPFLLRDSEQSHSRDFHFPAQINHSHRTCR